jgi:REP element-mobilizing transposase RayT
MIGRIFNFPPPSQTPVWERTLNLKNKLMRSTYRIYNDDYPQFITSTIIDWINIFSSDSYFKIMLENFKFYQSKYDMEIVAFVIMPNHFHAICNCNELRKAIQYIKSYSAKEILTQLHTDGFNKILTNLSMGKSSYKKKTNYQVWQESYHPQQIKDAKMLKQKIEYIHNNPVRKGLVENPEDWKYSSARFYLKDENCGLAITPYY